MEMIIASILSILLAACVPAWSAEASRERVLVLLDDPTSARQSHASFLGRIESMGLDVTIASASDDSISLRGVDEWVYDHLVVLGAESKFGEGVTAKQQLEFFESGRNLYLAINPSSIGNARALAGRLGADLEARSSLVRVAVGVFKNECELDVPRPPSLALSRPLSRSLALSRAR